MAATRTELTVDERARRGRLLLFDVDGVTGVVLDTRDPAVWGATVTRLLADRELWSRLARASRERAVEHPWSLSAAELADAVRRILALEGEARRRLADLSAGLREAPGPERAFAALSRSTTRR